ncbi:transposable element Tcb1 transposase [Trichonephila clavipes]|nr:transposable element Tcb1 transposase [Trichonephila clavipes]
MTLSLLTNHTSLCNTTTVRFESGDTVERGCSTAALCGPEPDIMGVATAIFQQDNDRPHVACIVQGFFVNHQIELLPWLARSPDLSPIENMWSMVAQRLTQITPSAAPPDQLWQRVEAAWFVVPQEHIQSLFESMPRRTAVGISSNGVLLWLLILAETTLHRSLNFII